MAKTRTEQEELIYRQQIGVPSDEQEEQTRLDMERKHEARSVAVASEHPNPLVESRTVRSPMIPQPEPDANPLQPLINRPSRSRNSENIESDHPVHETRTGEGDAPHTEQKKLSTPAKQPAGQVIEAKPEHQTETVVTGAGTKEVEVPEEGDQEKAAAKKAAAARKRRAAAKKSAAKRSQEKK